MIFDAGVQHAERPEPDRGAAARTFRTGAVWVNDHLERAAGRPRQGEMWIYKSFRNLRIVLIETNKTDGFMQNFQPELYFFYVGTVSAQKVRTTVQDEAT